MDREPECRINLLPEAILHLMLCFLPIKEAVRTSILCKRWRYLYTAIPVVEFDEADQQLQKTNLFTAIDQFLLSHVCSLRRFSLRLCLANETENSQFHRWLRHVTAVKKVEELSLAIYSCSSSFKLHRLPTHLFKNCRSLELSSGCHLNLDSVDALPNLKSLTFTWDFHYTDPSCRMLGKCPQLESLTFEVFRGIPRDLLIYVAHRIDSIKPTNLEIVAPRLQTFEFDCRGIRCRARASGDIVRVKTLTACHCFLKSLHQVDVGDPVPHQFNQLEVLIFRNPCAISEQLGLDFIASLLRRSPNLRVICIEDCTDLFREAASSDPPACLAQQLRVAFFKRFSGTKAELHLLKYVVECGPSLEYLRITFSTVLEQSFTIIAKELLFLQRQRPRLNIDFP